MIRLIAVAGFAAAITSVEAMTPCASSSARRHDGMITQVAYYCAPAEHELAACMARTTIRHVRRCARWYGGLVRSLVLDCQCVPQTNSNPPPTSHSAFVG
jgi:hypothetical protein